MRLPSAAQRAARWTRAAGAIARGEPVPWNPLAYRRWIERNETLTGADSAAIARHLAAMREPPLLSVVMPVFDPPPRYLAAAIKSVRAQFYERWELCIADDASTDPRIAVLLAEAASRDPRIRVRRRSRNGHISAATNDAIALARGAFLALMDHDDTLSRRALYEVAAVLERHPDADLIYSDEDKTDALAGRFSPFFKPDFSHELLLGQNFVSHLGVYRRSLVTRLGGMRTGFEGSQDHDLALRVAAATAPARIHHIPSILYHWRQNAGPATFSEAARDRCAERSRAAVQDHLARTGAGEAVAEPNPANPSWIRVRRMVPQALPLVSLVQCGTARNVLPATRYPHVEAVNDAARARGDILVFLREALEPLDPTWLCALVAQAVRPDVGMVAPRLLRRGERVGDAGYFGHLCLTREVATASSACLALRREIHHMANPGDPCRSVRALGYRVLWEPFAALRRRERDGEAEDDMAIRTTPDPFYNANFDDRYRDFRLAIRSRRELPWQRFREMRSRAQ